MKIRTCCAVLLFFPVITMAGVNTKNGNFFISYTDINQISGEREFHLTRAYNSKAVGIGWFGFGWGTAFEARAVVMPDGAVVVQENGGSGRESYYAPMNGGNLQAGVDKIVAAAIQHDKLEPEAADALRTKMLHDENLRRSSVAKYGIQTQLPIGGVAQSNDCTKAAIARIKDGYRRTTCEKNVDYFDLSGRLVRKEDNDYAITLHYAEKYPDIIEDSLGQKLFLKWTTRGRISEARTEKADPVLQYIYDEKDNLLVANTIYGTIYHYEYDNNHNMTKIVYIDDTHMDMEYNEKSLISSVIEVDGSKTTYSYREEPGNPSHYWTTTTLISASGKQSSREEEFLLTTDAAGVEHLGGLIRTEGQRKQNLVMDELGRVKYIQKPDGGFAEYFYHATFNKVCAVVTNEVSTVFTYNRASDLIRVYNTKGHLITLGYDSHKHINRMVDVNKVTGARCELTFEYNALGKPVKIKLIGKGEINVEYDQQGKISNVESKQGSKMAIGVSQAFQSLMGVVRVAGVDLGM